MRALAIASVTLALLAALAVTSAAAEEPGTGDHEGAWELTLEPVTGSMDTGLIGGEVYDYTVAGDRIVAVGSHVNRREVDRGAAWATSDRGEWEQTHRLPQRAGLTHAVPLDDGILAFGPRIDPQRERPIGTWSWRLGLDGSVNDSERVPSQNGGGQHPIDVAGHLDTGMVLLLGDQEWGRLEALYRAPGEAWQTVDLPRSATVDPLHVIETEDGFVVLGTKRRGLLAWRSDDGLVWTERELLPDSASSGDRGSTDLAYDADTERLIVVAHPDRVWLSEAGGPFEPVGPLPVSHAGSLEAYDGTHRAIALDDSFLVVTTDEVVGKRTQTSTDGRTWVPGPRLRVKTDGPEPGPQASARTLLRDGDRLLLDGSEPGELVSAPVEVGSYLASGAVGGAEDEGPLAFTFEPVEERSFEGWTEVGRAPGSDGYLERLRVLDGRLLAAGRWMPASEAFEWANRVWSSDDGWTWTASTLPGASPQVTDLDVRPDGSMAVAVGYSEDDWSGAVWITTDGLEWRAVTPPSKSEVDAVAVSDEVVAVSAGYRLWTTTDLEDWTRVRGPGTVVDVAYGPGGFLVEEGDALWRSADGDEWTKVRLPKALGNPPVDLSVFPLDDEWLLLPDKRGLMYGSPDGRRWRKIPRAPGMTVGYEGWMVDMGEAVQAEGHLFERKKPGSGVWTFVPGEPVAKPRVAPEGFIRTDSPVAWDDGYVGVGSMDGEEPDSTFLTLWHREGPEPAEAVGEQ